MIFVFRTLLDRNALKIFGGGRLSRTKTQASLLGTILSKLNPTAFFVPVQCSNPPPPPSGAPPLPVGHVVGARCPHRRGRPVQVWVLCLWALPPVSAFIPKTVALVVAWAFLRARPTHPP